MNIYLPHIKSYLIINLVVYIHANLQGVPKTIRQRFIQSLLEKILNSHIKQKQIWNSHYFSFPCHILFLSYPLPIVSIHMTMSITPILRCSVSLVTEQCEYPALYHVQLDISHIKSYLQV